MEHVSFVEGRGNLIVQYTPDGDTHGTVPEKLFFHRCQEFWLNILRLGEELCMCTLPLGLLTIQQVI